MYFAIWTPKIRYNNSKSLWLLKTVKIGALLSSEMQNFNYINFLPISPFFEILRCNVKQRIVYLFQIQYYNLSSVCTQRRKKITQVKFSVVRFCCNIFIKRQLSNVNLSKKKNDNSKRNMNIWYSFLFCYLSVYWHKCLTRH